MKRIALIVSLALTLVITPCIAFGANDGTVPTKCECGAGWNAPVMEWEDMDDPDNWECTFTLTCENASCDEKLVYYASDIVNDDDTLNENCPIWFSVAFEAPGCTTQGYERTVYYLDVVVDGIDTEFSTEKTIYSDPEHSWEISINWEDYFDVENWTYLVEQWCWGDCGITHDLTDQSTIEFYTEDPTCTSYGYKYGTVTIIFEGEEYNDTKVAELVPLGHDYDEDGCTRCSMVRLPEKCTCGASWNEPVWEWADEEDPDNWECTLTLTCKNEDCDEVHVANAHDLFDGENGLNPESPFTFSLDREFPDCYTEGATIYSYQVDVCVDGVWGNYATEKTMPIEPAHDWNVGILWDALFDPENWDYTVTLYCYGECETSIDLTDEASFELIKVTEPTCTEYGLYEGYVRITHDGIEYEDCKSVVIEPLGHIGDAETCTRCSNVGGEDDAEPEPEPSDPSNPNAPGATPNQPGNTSGDLAQTGDNTATVALTLIVLVAASCALIIKKKLLA